MRHKRRLFRIIRPRLQLRLILAFLGVSLLTLTLQYLLFLRTLTDEAARLPNDSAYLIGGLTTELTAIALWSYALLLPATWMVGILVTHRIAGPIYRFEVYLKQVLAGEARGDCRLRKGDELQDMCALINQVTAPLREQSQSNEAKDGRADRSAA